MRLARNADLTTHNVFHIRGDAWSRCRVFLRCGFDRGHQEHLSFITIINDRSATQTYRLRPANRARRKPRWKLPLDLRRFSRIAGVLPVNMPARVELKQ